MNISASYPIVIKENHLDTFGHVNNATYLSLYEEARWELISSRGFGLERVQREQIGPVILDLSLSFRRELTNREKIVIHTQCMGLKKNLILEMEQWMEKSDKSEASRLKLTFGLMDMKARKLIRPTKDWLFAVGLVYE